MSVNKFVGVQQRQLVLTPPAALSGDGQTADVGVDSDDDTLEGWCHFQAQLNA